VVWFFNHTPEFLKLHGDHRETDFIPVRQWDIYPRGAYNIPMFHRLLTLARGQYKMLGLTIFLGWAGGLLVILQAWSLSRVVDGVFLGGLSVQDVLPLLGILLVAVIIRACALGGMELTASATALQVKRDLRGRLMRHLIRLGPVYTGGERTGELTTAAIEGIEALDAFFSQYLPQVALAAFIPLSMLLLVFPIDPLTGLVFLLTAPLIPLFMYLIGKGAESLTWRQFQVIGRLSAYLLDVIQGLTTLKILGQSRAQEGNIQEASQQFHEATMNVLRVTFLSALVLELVAALSTAVVAVEIGLRLLEGRMDFGAALFILILAPDFYLPLRNLGLRFHAGMAGITAAGRIHEILEAPAPPPERKPVIPGQKTPDGTVSPTAASTQQGVFRSNILFDNVSFSYPTRDLPAVNALCFEIRQGCLTALVGASGAGKSTTAALLLRFIEPDLGHILVDGLPLNQIPIKHWRAQLAWVPQNPRLFNLSLRENLLLANPAASSAELNSALERAGLEEFVASLPQGLETPIGEQGTRLSSGQAQRLAIGRAFLRKAPLLILDEPTSGLDPALEARMLESVQELMKGRTALVIAHRLSTARRADQIVVFDSGGVVEVGKHAELVRQGGFYSRLVNIG